MNLRRYIMLMRDPLLIVVLFPPWLLMAIVALGLQSLLEREQRHQSP
jgi:hypothetical protein